LTPAHLWAEFAIPTPPAREGSPLLDGRSDVYQLALVAVSLIAGRRLTPDDYPDAVAELLDTIVRFESLRQWLKRALHLNDRGFESVRDADEALPESHQQWRDEGGFDAALRPPAPGALSQDTRPMILPPREDLPSAADIVQVAAARRPAARALRWVALAAGLVAVGEAAFIGRMLYLGSSDEPATSTTAAVASRQPAGEVLASDVPAPGTPLPVKAEPGTTASGVMPAVAAVNAEPRGGEVSVLPPNPRPAQEAPQSGGFRVSAPIELHVLDGERLLGSSGNGPIVARAGRHEFEFVNSVVGFRVRRQVEIRPGQIASLSIAIPNGTLNVNATPWATVWIDGKPYGETPLGNLSIAPGEYEIVFRHPQLGERRERTIVRPDEPGRVAVNMHR
jgi:hypothetical protein